MFMVTRDITAGAIRCSDDVCKRYASNSVEFNKSNPIFMEQFASHLEKLKINEAENKKEERSESRNAQMLLRHLHSLWKPSRPPTIQPQ